MDEKEKEIEIEEFKKIREQQDKESLKINITQNIMYKCVKNGFTIKKQQQEEKGVHKK